VSNIDPTHAIPLLIAGALQSGLAFVFMPTATGYVLLATEPEPMTEAEIEEHSEISAVITADIASMTVIELSLQLGMAVRKMADHISTNMMDEGVQDALTSFDEQGEAERPTLRIVPAPEETGDND
jgi:hypothetical protein